MFLPTRGSRGEANLNTKSVERTVVEVLTQLKISPLPKESHDVLPY